MSIRAQGLRTWLWQRLSAAYLAAFLLFSLAGGILAGPWDYVRWRALLTDPVYAVATALFFAALLLHAWVGGRDIIMDYVPAGALRFTALTLLALAVIVMGAWTVVILLLAQIT